MADEAETLKLDSMLRRRTLLQSVPALALAPMLSGLALASEGSDDDHEDTSGWGKSGRPAMVIAFTSTGRGECVAYSQDDGVTWKEFEGNPVVKHNGRDPRLLGTRRRNNGPSLFTTYDPVSIPLGLRAMGSLSIPPPISNRGANAVGSRAMRNARICSLCPSMAM